MSAALEIRGASKTFGSRRVLHDVALRLEPGEVHGLLGQNGSGKSTLIKILAGYHAPDPGAELEIGGRSVGLPLAPDQPRRLGVAFVHQDLGLVEGASVMENLRLGEFVTGYAGRISWAKERRRTRQALSGFGLTVDPDALVGGLTQVERAMLATLRAFEALRAHPNGVLVLDEPTAYLPRDSASRLFAAVRERVAEGVAAALVSHRLDEVRAVCDRVTILRDGACVRVAATDSLSEGEMVREILGFELDRLYPEPHSRGGEVALAVEGLDSETVAGLDLSVREGEVVGVTGLMGMGYERLPYLLFGAERARAGRLLCGGMTVDLRRHDERRAMAARIALLPANRLRDGGVAGATMTENVTLTTLRSHTRFGRIGRRGEARHVRALMEGFQVRPADPDQDLGTFSGGNQQKALLAKWFETGPRVFLMHEPTQGVDVGARRQIFEQIRDAAEGGTAFILASAEYEDLAALCDRVVVFRHGRPVAELAGERLGHHEIVSACYAEPVAVG